MRLHHTTLILLFAVSGCYADMSLLGLGGGGGGMVKGSSFNLDTKTRMTRVHGKGLTVDLEVLELMTCGGSLKYSPTQIEFSKGSMRWVTTMSEGLISVNHNDKTVLQLSAPDSSNYYQFSLQGEANFRDVFLDQTLAAQAATDLCVMLNEVSRISAVTSSLNANEIGVAPPTISDQAVRLDCAKKVKAEQYSVQQTLDAVARDLLKLAHETSMATSALKKKSDNTLKLDMFTKLKTELETFRNDLGKNFKTSEIELKKAVDSSVAALESRVGGLSDSVNSTVLALREETRQILQVECVAHVNSSISQMEAQTDSALASIRAMVQAAVDSVSASLSDVIDNRLPAIAAATEGRLDTLDGRVTYSNQKIDESSSALMSHLSDAMNVTRNDSLALRADVWGALSALNASTAAAVEEAVGHMQGRLLTLAVNTDEELGALLAADEAMAARIEALRADVYGNITNATEANGQAVLLLQAALAALQATVQDELSVSLSVLNDNVTVSVTALEETLNTTTLVLAEQLQAAQHSTAANLTQVSEDARNFTNKLSQRVDDLIDELKIAMDTNMDALNASTALGFAYLDDRLGLLNESASLQYDDLSKALINASADLRAEIGGVNLEVRAALTAVNASHSSQLAEATAAISALDSNLSALSTATQRLVNDHVSELSGNIAALHDMHLNLTEDVSAIEQWVSEININASWSIGLLNLSLSDAIAASNISAQMEITSMKALLTDLEHRSDSVLQHLTTSMLNHSDTLESELLHRITLLAEETKNRSALIHRDLSTRLNESHEALSEAVSAVNTSAQESAREISAAMAVGRVALERQMSHMADELLNVTMEMNASTKHALDGLYKSMTEADSVMDAKLSAAVNNATSEMHGLNASLAKDIDSVSGRLDVLSRTEEAHHNTTLDTIRSQTAQMNESVSALNHSLSSAFSSLSSLYRVAEGELRLAVQVFNLSLANRLWSLEASSAETGAKLNASLAIAHNAVAALSARADAAISLHTGQLAALNESHRSAALSHSAALANASSLITAQQKAIADAADGLAVVKNTAQSTAAEMASLLRSHSDLSLFTKEGIARLNTSALATSKDTASSLSQLRSDLSSSVAGMSARAEQRWATIEQTTVAPLVKDVAATAAAVVEVKAQQTALASRIDAVRDEYVAPELRRLSSELRTHLDVSVDGLNKSLALVERSAAAHVSALREELYQQVVAASLNSSATLRADIQFIKDVKIGPLSERLYGSEARLNVTLAQLQSVSMDLDQLKRVSVETCAELSTHKEHAAAVIAPQLAAMQTAQESIVSMVKAAAETSAEKLSALSSQVQVLAVNGKESSEKVAADASSALSALRVEVSDRLGAADGKIDKVASDMSAGVAAMSTEFRSVVQSMGDSHRVSQETIAHRVEMLDRQVFLNSTSLSNRFDAMEDQTGTRLLILESASGEVDERVKDLAVRLAAAEATILQQQQTIAYLQNKLDVQIKEAASLNSVDTLRREFQQLQTAMMEHSGKVLDLLTANVAGGRK